MAPDLVRCPVCGKAERAVWIAQHCGMEPREQAQRLAHWNVPAFKDAGKRKQREQARATMEAAIEDRTGLWTFYGDYGAGKTMALQIVVNEVRISQAVEGYYAPFAQVLDTLRNCYDARGGATEFWQRILDVPALALDEVTRFRADNEWQQQQLFVLVDTRYRRRHSHLTLFATNDDPTRRLPASEPLGYLYSRLREGRLSELRGDVREAVKS